LLAYQHGRTGERYILGNENITLRALLERLAALAGRPAPAVRVPPLVPLLYAAAGEFVLEPLGLRPDVPFDGVRMAQQRMYYSAAKAAVQLGLPRRPVTAALADAVTWFQEHGYFSTPSGRERGNRT
jgi:dihydroflavonol-4-reductase